MVTRHVEAAKDISKRGMALDLIVGMTGYDGLPIHSHMGFKSIASQSDPSDFSCSYVTAGVSVHSKLYVWTRKGEPVAAWTGSANYTQNGFGVGTRSSRHFEVMSPTSAPDALAYFASTALKTVRCDAENVDDLVSFYTQIEPNSVQTARSDESAQVALSSLDHVDLPLFITRGAGKGTVHDRSGLNWGQRPGREPNQAYIPVPVEVARSGFFPPKGVHFNLVTTDGKSMLMAVAQEGNKALESTQSNALIGKYFRDRLGLSGGAKVRIEDLDAFGNRYASIYKVDDSEYVLDYRPVTATVLSTN